MKRTLFAVLALGATLFAVAPSFAQGPRLDAVWARSTNGAAITLDGNLNEPGWAVADSVKIRYRKDNGIPGSGWKDEGGFPGKDSTRATIKFLVNGNQLYMAFIVPDSSVGGGAVFNRFDGLLMGLKDHSQAGRPAPIAEYFYSWWYPDSAGVLAPTTKPSFRGSWGQQLDGTRTPAQVAAWDAFTLVNGLVSNDVAVDGGYVVEMRYDLNVMGYNTTQVAGDIMEWNCSIYDCDWYWQANAFRLAANRSWLQSAWGNVLEMNEVRIHAKPSVNITSGPAPVIAPEVIIKNGAAAASPVIDGSLSDAVWANASSFDIRYGDDALRNSYPGVAKYRSGQYQPPVNGGQAFVQDPGDATVKYFFKADTLFLGFDVRDQIVQYHPNFDSWDGFIISIKDRFIRDPLDRNLASRRLTFQVGPTGQALAQDYMIVLRDSLNGARLAMQLKPGTTVDTLGLQADAGYTAELAINLTKLGYPTGRGDGVLFWGVDLLDGDSYSPFTDSYGTRTWWYQEYAGTCCPSWSYMDPNTPIVADVDEGGPTPSQFMLLGSFPNPSVRGTTLRYSLPIASDVTLEVYDPQGRLVSRQPMGTQTSGIRTATIDRVGTHSGLFLYRLRVNDPVSGAERATLSGKVMFLK